MTWISRLVVGLLWSMLAALVVLLGIGVSTMDTGNSEHLWAVRLWLSGMVLMLLSSGHIFWTRILWPDQGGIGSMVSEYIAVWLTRVFGAYVVLILFLVFGYGIVTAIRGIGAQANEESQQQVSLKSPAQSRAAADENTTR